MHPNPTPARRFNLNNIACVHLNFGTARKYFDPAIATYDGIHA
jgi:hypothetical protein